MGGERDRVEPVVDSDLLSDVVIRITLKMVTRWNNALGKSPLYIPFIITYNVQIYQQRIQSKMFCCFTLKADSESTEYKKMAQILTDITESAYVDIKGQELATILDFR